MNPLHDYLTRRGMDAPSAMNTLQDAGIISDLCVTVHDVPIMDAERAVSWLEGQRAPEQAMLW